MLKIFWNSKRRAFQYNRSRQKSIRHRLSLLRSRREKRSICKRGGILDIYDPTYPDPVRIEFFGDEIDDIRFFKANDELSYRHVDSFALHPCSLFLLNSDEIRHGLSTVQNSLKAMAETSDRLSFDDLQDRMRRLGENACNGFLPPSISVSILFSNKSSPPFWTTSMAIPFTFTMPRLAWRAERTSSRKRRTTFARATFPVFPSRGKSLSKRGNRLCQLSSGLLARGECLRFERKQLPFPFLCRKRQDGSTVSAGRKQGPHRPPGAESFQFPELPGGKEIPFSSSRSTHLSCSSKGKSPTGSKSPKKACLSFGKGDLWRLGPAIPCSSPATRESKIIRRYEDLKEGDYVVHEVHGVGRYMGVTTLDGLEYLKIEYADEAIFFLPLNQYRLIRKYASREGYAPSLDKIGGSTWSRKKAKIRSKISYLADQLLSLYSERRSRTGFAFPTEREFEDAFLRTFPYPYTRSQREAMEDVRKDMESLIRWTASSPAMWASERRKSPSMPPSRPFSPTSKSPSSVRRPFFATNISKSPKSPCHLRHRICAFSRFVSKKEQEENIEKNTEGRIRSRHRHASPSLR